MCLVTEQKRVKIAKEDIPVYKALRSDLTTIYQTGFQYKLGKMNETTITEVVDDNFYGNGDSYYYERARDRGKEIHFYAEGFHTFTTLEEAKKNCSEFTIVAGIIPKGARYYTNKFNMAVSNKLLLTEIIQKGDYN